MSIRLPRRGRIAIVPLHGTLGTTLQSDEYDRLFEQLRDDAAVKAVVLDVDSGGGDVSTSSYFQMAVSKLSEEKPVIAFVRGTCASGAYLVSCAARRIVAMPYSLVGSIGVLSMWPVASELMERLGLEIEVSKSGRLKDMQSFWRPPTAEEREQSQELVDQFHREFVETVARSRDMEKDAISALATGQVFWAKQAHELRLVDEIGDRERAIELAMELGEVPRRLFYPKPRRRGWSRWLRRLLGTATREVLIQIEPWLRPRLWL